MHNTEYSLKSPSWTEIGHNLNKNSNNFRLAHFCDSKYFNIEGTKAQNTWCGLYQNFYRIMITHVVRLNTPYQSTEIRCGMLSEVDVGELFTTQHSYYVWKLFWTNSTHRHTICLCLKVIWFVDHGRSQNFWLGGSCVRCCANVPRHGALAVGAPKLTEFFRTSD